MTCKHATLEFMHQQMGSHPHLLGRLVLPRLGHVAGDCVASRGADATTDVRSAKGSSMAMAMKLCELVV